MDKIVASGESNCYVTLTESNECAVKFDRTYRMFAVNNTSENEAIMSLSPNKSRTDDGVRIIPAGESRTLTTSGIDSDTVYINGNGSVEVAALNGNSVNPFFKGSSGGGGGGSSYIPNSEKGVAGGVATLDISGKVPADQLPSYVDDVIDGYYYESSFYADSEHTQLIVGETGKIYNDVSTNISYRWNGTGYTAMSVQNAVTYTSQALTTEQKTQARENIGAAASDDIPTNAVKYTAQTLTDAQKTQARTNIGAGTSNFSGNYDDLDNAPDMTFIQPEISGMVDSGLGWRAQQAYYTDTAGNPQYYAQCLSYTDAYNGGYSLKINNGPSICAFIRDPNLIWGVYLLSTLESAAVINYTESRTSPVETISPVASNSWYIAGQIIDIGNYAPGKNRNYPDIVLPSDSTFRNADFGTDAATRAEAVRIILEAAHAIPPTSFNVPTVECTEQRYANAVKYTEQSLTSAQQAQARTNIGAANAADVPTAAQQAAWSAKQDALTFDSAPVQNSTNPVTSGGIYTALQSAGVQSDWAQYNSSEMDFIKNKPALSVGHGVGGNIEGGTGGTLYNYAVCSNSVAYGYIANATADYTLAFGFGVNANHSYEVAFGKYNQSNADTAFSIGDGTGTGATPNHNLMELKTNGKLFVNGNETASKNDVDTVNKRCDDIIDMIEDKTVIYGFHVDPDESDPSNAVTYLADAVSMTPAAMGATTFNYGSWKNAFFMPQPCMLKYDGTVDYYLDPNDYSKKLDGTASDILDYSYNGNAMMEFPKLWFKFESGAAEGEGYFWVSNKQVDSSYHCYANYDADGNQTDHFYMSIYNGVIYDGKMRSLSGKKLSPWSATAYSSSATYAVDSIVNYEGKMWKCVTAVETAEEFDPTKWEQFGFNGNTTGQHEVDAAVANDTTAKSEWYIDVWCDRVLITALLYLMGKSLDLQSTYGRGIDSGSQTAAENYVTGTANDKGLFYGVTADGDSVVKVFGIENFWGLKWRRTAGCIGKNDGTVAYKMTLSTADGSTATAYNTDGTGYLIDNTIRPSNGYVSKMGFGNWGLMPRSVTGGNSNVYYCDYFYTANTATRFALVGGCSHDSLECGFYVYLNFTFATRGWYVAAALSCKPLANRGE